ncbi:myosin [Salpingoeca rosetta]|uniref:Myosin n=1 Tax=Salpingoeca rosetta (strain ATCC 50818 / BSB-021) TaxID=946362 RepID=F2UNA3_SALR5|nr:myosin [Salpingoeca rosetta]EGD79108.1 myosin [Salpingoeca rosetta]|eukprot:XP_004989193.1 myosin [Salpingoeca rosetta]
MAEKNDLALEEELDEDMLTNILKERYQQRIIYTYVGDILIAVNPYEDLSLYTAEQTATYCNVANKADHPPHIFAIADNAFGEMMRNHQRQVAVISGESGAGKTESTKLFIRHVMDVSARGILNTATPATRTRHPLEEKIIQLNPILESFGNAQTVMNDNSSRFGKFVELKFNESGVVQGASLSHYLLEKARVVKQGPGERNFHIFEQLLSGLSQDERAEYGLASQTEYSYLSSRVNDTEQLTNEFSEIASALNKVGFTSQEIGDIHRVLASILLFGNLEFDDAESDGAVVTNEEVIEAIARNLGVERKVLEKGFMTSKIKVMGDIIVRPLNPSKCQHSKNAVAKALYDRLFTWTVTRLDMMLCPTEATTAVHSIGILDIFGFENFTFNGFDQLCINLANESLHHFFNQHIFAAEMKAYEDEEIDGMSVMFSDNVHVLNLFYENPGVLHILDEQTKFAQGNASALVKTLKEQLADHALFEVKQGDLSFEIKHYAGPIAYEIDGLIEKNKDPLPEAMASSMSTSTNALVSLLFHHNLVSATRKGAARTRARELTRELSRQTTRRITRAATVKHKSVKKQAADLGFENPDTNKGLLGRIARTFKRPNVETVSSQFKQSLDALMYKMSLCSPHFVRCIKPNPNKMPRQYEDALVLKQMQYTGMLQTIKMRREGFSVRMSFEELISSYQGIVFKFSDKMKYTKGVAEELLIKCAEKQEANRQDQKLTSSLSGWLIAKTKVFLKYWHPDVLDALLLDSKIAAVRIQSWVRRFLAQKRFRPRLQAYRDQLAMAVSFLHDMKSRGHQTFLALETLVEEEERRGPEDLGIATPVDKKKENKEKRKMLKEAHKDVDMRKLRKTHAKEQKDVLRWWKKYEKPRRAHLDAHGRVHTWFHGLMSRGEAEEFLFEEPDGTFLIRVSETSRNYAISVKVNGRCKHYRINTGVGYQVLGSDEDFGTLEDLVDFYGEEPLSPANDRLQRPLDALHDLRLGFGNANMANPVFPTGGRSMKLDGNARASTSQRLRREDYLRNPKQPPSWLRGKLSRSEAESELKKRGLASGRFLVREREVGVDSVTFVVSYTHDRRFFHHLLVRDIDEDWTLNDRPLRVRYLDDVIAKFQGRKYPGLATRLESDAPEPVKRA